MEEQMISEFNEAQVQIYRLHAIWVNCHLAINKGDYKRWAIELEKAEMELKDDLTILDHRKKTKERKRYLNFINFKIDDSLTPTEKYSFLKKKTEFLKKIQRESGKGAKYKPEYEPM